MQYITDIIVALIGLAGICMPFIANRKQDQRKDKDGLKQAVRSLLYADLEHRCLKFIERGYIPHDEFKRLTEDWHVYHDPDKLNGNGYLDELMSRVNKLPIKEG